MTRSPRQRAVVPVVVVLAMLLLHWRLRGSERWAALVEARARRATVHMELAAARREVAARADTKQAVREAARALRRAAARLPDQRELAALLASVAQRARAAGLELLLLRPTGEHAATDHMQVRVELQVRGTFRDVLAFLRSLEHLGRLVHLGDLRIDRPARAGDRLVVELRCTAVTYRLASAVERRPARAPRSEEPG